MSAHALSRRDLFAYAIVGLPLAMVALPIYVHVPKYYGDTLGVDLGTVGLILLLLRLLDGVVDPLLGAWSDRLADRGTAIAWSAVPLAIGIVALFMPFAETAAGRAAWLAVTLAVVYAAYSLATINHASWGAEIAGDAHQRTRVTATREGLALAGVMLAAVIPGLGWLSADGANGLRSLSWIFVITLAVGVAWTLLLAPRSRVRAGSTHNVRDVLRKLLAIAEFRRLLAVFVINGTAAAIPATLVLFFIDDVIGAPQHQGAFLATYFLSGALAMPLWIALARRIGKAPAWLAAMVLAIVTFVWALLLGRGDIFAFFVICACSGIALSADLALPPSMLADAIARGPKSLGAGSYFGIWTMASKLNLALAAGIALPLVGWLGYRPGAAAGTGLSSLTLVYAGVPCALKLIAVFAGWRLLARPASAPSTPSPHSKPYLPMS